MRAQLLQDVIAVATEVYPFPSFSDAAAVSAWVGTLTKGVTQVVYDAITSDPLPATKCAALQQATLGAFSDEEVIYAFEAVKAGKAAVGQAGAIGDGTILNFLESVNWAQLIQTVISIINVIPKQAAA